MRGVAYSPDGARLARAEGRDVVVCDAVTGFEVCQFTGHKDNIKSVAFSPNGKLVASDSENKTVIIWDLSTGACHSTLIEHLDRVVSVAFSPDSKLVVISSGDQTVKICDVSTGFCPVDACQTLEDRAFCGYFA